MVVQSISGFESEAVARGALVAFGQLMLRLEVGFHVVPLGCYIRLGCLMTQPTLPPTVRLSHSIGRHHI